VGRRTMADAQLRAHAGVASRPTGVVCAAGFEESAQLQLQTAVVPATRVNVECVKRAAAEVLACKIGGQRS
jgi:hypothetical protein